MTMTACLKLIFGLCLSLLATSINSFVIPNSVARAHARVAGTVLTVNAETNTENWTWNPFDINDLSPVDTLMRRGVVPLGIRLLRPQKYEEAVQTYMRKEGCDRPTAQRNMDAFFNDPNGWVVAYGRMRDLGEDFGDVNGPTGVQKRPVFSFFWAIFCGWFFFSFLPTRTAELGGINPSLPNNGVCRYPVRGEDGKLKCPTFDEYAMQYLKEGQD